MARSPTTSNVSVGLKSYTNTSIVYPYQTAYLQITVTNKGSQALQSFPVVFYIDGNLSNSYKVSLGAGKNTTINTTYTYLEPGSYTFTAVGDPGMLFPVSDRNATKSEVTVNVTDPQYPDIYSSIPNDNISYTQSFSIDQTGVTFFPFFATNYNLTIVNGLFGIDKLTFEKFFQDFGGYIGQINGAYVKYDSNTTAYIMWIQGTATPQEIESFFQSYGFSQKVYTSNNTQVLFTRVSSNQSACTYYSEGWIRMVVYDNHSTSNTCQNVLSFSKANSTESVVLLDALKNNPNVTKDLRNLTLRNSTPIGYSVVYSGNSVTSINFEKNSAGWLNINLVSNQTTIKNNETCYGLIYTENDVQICSVYIFAASGNIYQSSGEALLNTTTSTKNMQFGIYTLLNQSYVGEGSQLADTQLAGLPFNSNTLIWASPFFNSCNFFNNTIGCTKRPSFNYTSSTAMLNITNNQTSPITLTTLSCSIAYQTYNNTLNLTIGAGKSSNTLDVICPGAPLNLASATNEYGLALYYNIARSSNAIKVYGVLNITNGV